MLGSGGSEDRLNDRSTAVQLVKSKQEPDMGQAEVGLGIGGFGEMCRSRLCREEENQQEVGDWRVVDNKGPQ